MIPRALEKAASLSRFVATQGEPRTSFALTLSLGEAYELLDFIAAGGLGYVVNHSLLVTDIEQAKILSDPWRVLEHFQLEGFNILRADLVLH
jgi:hypothetical protein